MFPDEVWDPDVDDFGEAVDAGPRAPWRSRLAAGTPTPPSRRRMAA